MSTRAAASNRSANVMQCTAKYQGASSMHCSVTFSLQKYLGERERSDFFDTRAFPTNLTLENYTYITLNMQKPMA